MKNNGYLWGTILAVLVIIAAVFIFRAHKAGAPNNTGSPTASSTTVGTTTNLGNGVSVKLPPGASVTSITNGASGGLAAPDLNHQVAYSPSLSADAVAQFKSKIAQTTAVLKANGNQQDYWLQLAQYYQEAGDYTAAANVWVYLTNISPTNYVAYGNLGALYMTYVKNYPKAEADYKAAIAIKPDVIDYYRELFLLYTTVYKTNTTAAADIVAQGLKANPGNADLLQLQSQLQTKTQ